jgi:hypothetical protein
LVTIQGGWTKSMVMAALIAARRCSWSDDARLSARKVVHGTPL